jgi:hypothetical protein
MIRRFTKGIPLCGELNVKIHMYAYWNADSNCEKGRGVQPDFTKRNRCSMEQSSGVRIIKGEELTEAKRTLPALKIAVDIIAHFV